MLVFLEPLKSSSCAPHPELFPKSQRVFDAKEPQEFINTALCDDVFLEKSQTHVIFVRIKGFIVPPIVPYREKNIDVTKLLPFQQNYCTLTAMKPT
jgi:hypothetical protein